MYHTRMRTAVPLLAAIVAGTMNTHCASANSRTLNAYNGYLMRSDARYAARTAGEEPRDGAVKVTFFGTTTLLIDDGATQMMIDGFLTRPRLRRLNADVQTNPLIVDAALARSGVSERLKAVFVSHSHYDHALDVVHIVKNHDGAVLFGSPSTEMIGRGGGLGDRARTFRAGEIIQVGDFTVSVLASKHSPPTLVNNDLGVPITQPLYQPARISDYKEGGSYDFMIRHGAHTMLVKASANFVADALNGITADVVFLGTGRLAKQNRAFRDAFFDETVGRVRPQLVIPIHWDDLFAPLTENLSFPSRLIDDSAEAFEWLLTRITEMNRREPSADGDIAFRILQGYESAVLFRKRDGLP